MFLALDQGVFDPTPPGHIALRGDDDDFDNTVYVIPPTQTRVNVLWLGSDNADDQAAPLFFLRRALTDTPRIGVQIVARAPGATLTAEEIKAAQIVFVTEALPIPTLNGLREQAVQRGTVAHVAGVGQHARARHPGIEPRDTAVVQIQ